MCGSFREVAGGRLGHRRVNRLSHPRRSIYLSPCRRNRRGLRANNEFPLSPKML
jgi:hypothetical protein